MYQYRKWTPQQRQAALEERRKRRYPMHSPPHLPEPGRYRLITGTCYEHSHFLDTPERLTWFESELLQNLKEQSADCAAWVIISNHYHALVKIDDIKQFTRKLGQLHGRTSLEMNREDSTPGRQVWYRCQDRCMRSEAHYYATINYIHNNPVKHGHVKRWSDWAYSSFHWYLENKGRDWLINLWRQYPILDYGAKWDI
jgi:putative transposase